jgi:hypothetical protein
MLAGPRHRALIGFWVHFHSIREANSVCIPLRSFIVSIYYWIFSITREKPSYEDANSLHDLLVRQRAAREPRNSINIVASLVTRDIRSSRIIP